MAENKNKKIVVVGGGIAGLSAALELQDSGHEVLVLEKESHPGGRMYTLDNWHGYDNVEAGASYFMKNDKRTFELLDRLGLLHLVKPSSGLKITVMRNGKLHTADFLNVFSLINWGGLSGQAKGALFFKLVPYLAKWAILSKVAPRSKQSGDEYHDSFHIERISVGDDNITFEELFQKVIGNTETFETLILSMFETMCSYGSEDLSAKAFAALMVKYASSGSVTIEGGLGTVTKALAALLPVQLNTVVRNIRPLPNCSGARVTYVQGNGIERSIECDAVIVAVPGNIVPKLFASADMKPAWKEFFPVSYSKGGMHYLLVETESGIELPDTLFLPRGTKLPINSISCEAERKIKSGRELLLMTDPRVGGDWESKTDDELAETSLGVINQIFPNLKGKLKAHIFFRWQGVVPTIRPNYLVKLAKFWEDPQEDGIFFAGDWAVASPSTGGARVSGLEAADRVKAWFNKNH